jgi:NTE family protein
MKFPIYDDFKETYLYRNHFSQSDLKVQHTFGQHAALGVGTSYETFGLLPKIAGMADVEAGNNYWHSYLYFKLTRLNQKHFSTKGWQVQSRLSGIYNQQPDDLLYDIGGNAGIIDTLSFGNYGQIRLNVENYLPLASRVSLLSQLNAGLNIKSNQSYLNFFNVGGLTDFLRNQITFAGLGEFQVRGNSVAVLALGAQYNPIKSLYVSVRANAALSNFSYTNGSMDSGDFLSGYALTAGYNSALGPLQFSMMYCDQTGKFVGYANIGLHF